MIPKSTLYKLVINGIVIAQGNKAEMRKLRKHMSRNPGDVVSIYFTDTPIGERVK